MVSDIAFVNGIVWTEGAFKPRTVTVESGQITSIEAPSHLFRPEAIQTVDLNGGTLLPGFGDGHAHPLIAGLEYNFAPVRGLRSVSEIQERVRAWAAASPEPEWIYGEGFELTLAPGGRFEARWLDEAVEDRPVVLRANDIHTVWCNTEALRRCGLLDSREDPVDGWLDRYPDGTPTGTLREWGAFQPVLQRLPVVAVDDKVTALRSAAQTLASAGVTWVQDAWVEAEDVATYLRAADDPTFSVRMNLALRADPHTWTEQRDEFRAARTLALSHPASKAISVRTVKFFVDGIIESGTASLLEEYLDHPGCCGLPNWERGALLEAIAAFDADGFQVHIHAMGDAGVRMALDAIEHATAANGPRDRRPVITHVQLISHDDVSRFRALGVTATFQPVWAQNDRLMQELTAPRLGQPRGARQYPIATMLASGANVSFASDWPITTHRPLVGIAVATTRRAPGSSSESWIPDKCVSVREAIDAYTTSVAIQAFEEDQWGSIRVGMRADLTYILEDVREIGAADFAKMTVVGTWLGGLATHSI